MAKYLHFNNSDKMDLIFGALADPTRRSILHRLTDGDLTVSEIAKTYDYSLPTISKHLSVLERAKLVRRNKIGRNYKVYFEPDTMKTVSEYVSYYSKFWTEKLNNLERFLANK